MTSETFMKCQTFAITVRAVDPIWRGVHHATVQTGEDPSWSSLRTTEHFWHAHGFTFPSTMLLNDNMIGQMWRELHSSPRKLSIYLTATLRIQSYIAPKTKTYCHRHKSLVIPLPPRILMMMRLARVWRRTREPRAFLMNLACITKWDQTFWSLRLQDAFVHREQESPPSGCKKTG